MSPAASPSAGPKMLLPAAVPAIGAWPVLQRLTWQPQEAAGPPEAMGWEQ